jgi:hypothetical protein
MTQKTIGGERRGASAWRLLAWVGALSLLLVPLVAMQLTDAVDWTPFDFVFAATLIGGAGLALELFASRSTGLAYRAGGALAVANVFALVWINGAVGIIGSEEDPANLMFALVLAVALVGALLARLRPAGMARALLAAALVQAAIGGVALAAGLGATSHNWPRDVAGLTGVFTLSWLASAALFRKAARQALR